VIGNITHCSDQQDVASLILIGRMGIPHAWTEPLAQPETPALADPAGAASTTVLGPELQTSPKAGTTLGPQPIGERRTTTDTGGLPLGSLTSVWPGSTQARRTPASLSRGRSHRFDPCHAHQHTARHPLRDVRCQQVVSNASMRRPASHCPRRPQFRYWAAEVDRWVEQDGR
jgi:hypothetical protein